MNHPKTENLLLYIAYRMKDAEGYGATMLNKVLYYIDSISYLHTGEPISSFSYIKQEFGPTPSPQEFFQVRNRLLLKDGLEEVSVPFFGRVQKKLVAKKMADVSVFTAEEVDIIEEVIEAFKNANATMVSDFSHKEISWQVAKNMESLPFYTYLLTSEAPTDRDLTWANEQKRRFINAFPDNKG